jgi:hypothetical protein
MAGHGHLKAQTESIGETGRTIQVDTDALQAQTNSLLGQLHNTCSLMPSVVYQELAGGLSIWGELLRYASEKRNHLGYRLGQVAKAIEEQEDQVRGQFGSRV